MAKVVFLHPDLGIGGAERLVVDMALALRSRDHHVTIYTTHHDPSHAFSETKDGMWKQGDNIWTVGGERDLEL